VNSILFSELIRQVPGEVLAVEDDTHIGGIAYDSRQVQPGDLFVALSGGNTDGHRYIPDAIQRGAAAAVGTQLISGLKVPYAQVRDGRLALAHLAAAFYGHPARKLTMIGVTGTDGKTTTANLVYSILRAAGLRTGMISTVNAQIGDEILDTGFHVTTPEAPDVQRYLAKMVEAGLTHVVLEATSHGLAQDRVAACDFDLGLVTNITHEHLDYHGSYEAYRQAKGRLFSWLAETPPKAGNPRRGAALNKDDSSFEYLAGITHVPWLSYGLGSDVQVQARNIRHGADGLEFEVVGIDLEDEPFTFGLRSPLIGAYNTWNILAAVTLGRGLMRLEPGAIQAGVEAISGVPGRMERIDMGQSFTAIVDFAHTPNALRRALEAARLLCSGRVIAVFGSAGLRDRMKRRMMAEISAELADLTVLTAEDPRSEPVSSILEEMAQGMRDRGGMEGRTYWRIPDRREALRFAVRLAKEGDLVIACGKGHEQSMCFGEVEYPWDDRIAMRAALGEVTGASGPEMPFLPDPDQYPDID
jgi:UDP-N-acetylmuramoyl-L-alanyl-D-glutamate--2,6-diaminopimelate ligase